MRTIYAAIIAVFFCVGVSYGQVATSGGGTSTTRIEGNRKILLHEFFRNFSLSGKWGTLVGHSGEYVYNEAGGSSSTAGWVRVAEYPDSLDLEITCPIMPSTGTISVRVEQRIGDTGTGSVSFTTTFNGTSSSLCIPIMERPDWMRVGENIDEISSEQLSVKIKATKIEKD